MNSKEDYSTLTVDDIIDRFNELSRTNRESQENILEVSTMNSKGYYSLLFSILDDIIDRFNELDMYLDTIEDTSLGYGTNDYSCYDDYNQKDGSNNNDEDEDENNDIYYVCDDDSIQYRKREKQKKKIGNILTGKGQSSRKRKRKIANIIEYKNQIPDLVKHISICKVSKDIAYEDMFKYIASMGFTIYALTCVSNTNTKFKSFRLTVPHWELNQLLDENLWPKDMRVKQYIFPKKKRSIHGM